MTDKKKMNIEITQRHRAAIQKFMDSRGFNNNSWCKKAGVREGTLRNFLNGAKDKPQSMTSITLHRLAKAAGSTVGEILGEENLYKENQELFALANKAADRYIEEKNLDLPARKIAEIVLQLYTVAVNQRIEGGEISEYAILYRWHREKF